MDSVTSDARTPLTASADSGLKIAVVLVDTRRIDDSRYAIDRLERHGTPCIVARNDVDGPAPTPAQLREALDLDPHVPPLDRDARSRESGKRVLITLVEHVKSPYASRPAHVAASHQELV